MSEQPGKLHNFHLALVESQEMQRRVERLKEEFGTGAGGPALNTAMKLFSAAEDALTRAAVASIPQEVLDRLPDV